MFRSFAVVVTVASALALAPASVAAEDQDRPLSELLPTMYREAIRGEVRAFAVVLPEFGVPVDGPTLLRKAEDRADTASQIIKLAGNQLSSFPLASASGGFTWTFDTASGLATRASNSFGPIFAERPLTIGRRRLNVGANVQHVTFDHLEERRLQGGEIVGYLSVPFFDEHIFFADSLDLTVTTDTLNAFATYGLTDRLDIGVAVPLNRVEMHATLTSRIGDTSSGVDDPTPLVRSTAGKATGIGDVVIRAKYNMLRGSSWGISESVDVRLPTGDELNLLGIAGPQVKLTFIAASALGQLSPHANLAYTISGASEAASDSRAFVSAPPEEINYAAGADLALSLRVTVAADVVGRVMRKAGTMVWTPVDFDGDEYPQYQQFDVIAGKDLHLLLGSVGAKVNPFKNMLFTANVLFPLTKNGLTDRLTWMAGLDYSF
jgi:hypothetical protein